MPFTFSHPAIVLPLQYLPKRWFSLTGLVAGSLTPDFEYFIRMQVKSDYSHTIGGIFWFDLPLGIVLAFIFHQIVRNSLFDNLPSFFRYRFSAFKSFNWNSYFKQNWLVVLFSVITGAASHILWDAFTHEHGYFVQHIPLLTGMVDLTEKQVPVFKILQHTSTLLGAFVIVFAIYNMPTHKTGSENICLRYWFILGILTIFIIVLMLLTGLELNQYGNIIVTSISAVLSSLVITSSLYGRLATWEKL